MHPPLTAPARVTERTLKTSAAPVAVFDSGIGGIGVLRELQRALPHENFLYFGDTAMAPYGERPHDEIQALVLRHATRLLSRAKALVLACNTATAVAAEALRATYQNVPIIGMEPAIRPALFVRSHPTVLILATPATLREQKLTCLLHTYAERADFIKCAAPSLVRLAEEGHFDDAATARELNALLAPITAARSPDAVVLGCTHFPFLSPAISRYFGDTVPLFDGAAGTARETARRLTAAGLCNTQKKHGVTVLTASNAASLNAMRRLL